MKNRVNQITLARLGLLALLGSTLVGCMATLTEVDESADTIEAEAAVNALSLPAGDRFLQPGGEDDSWLAQDGTSGNPGTLSGCHADASHCHACSGTYVDRECAEYSILRGCLRYAAAFCNYNPAGGIQQ